MIGNPRYGRIGLVVLPYFLVFEMLGAVVEMFGVAVVVVGLVLGRRQRGVRAALRRDRRSATDSCCPSWR